MLIYLTFKAIQLQNILNECPHSSVCWPPKAKSLVIFFFKNERDPRIQTKNLPLPYFLLFQQNTFFISGLGKKTKYKNMKLLRQELKKKIGSEKNTLTVLFLRTKKKRTGLLKWCPYLDVFVKPLFRTKTNNQFNKKVNKAERKINPFLILI